MRGTRVRVWTLGVAAGMAAALGGCSAGADIGTSIGNAIGSTFACGLAQCESSANVPTDEIQATYSVSQSGQSVSVTAGFRDSTKLINLVQLQDGDSVMVEPDTTLQPTDEIDTTYATQFTETTAQATVVIVLEHGGQSYASSVVLPPQIAFVDGTGQAAALTATGAALQVELNVPIDASVSLVAYGSCVLDDQSTFTVNQSAPAVLAPTALQATESGSLWSETGADLAAKMASLAGSSSSPLASCQLSFEWRVTAAGTVDPSLASSSSIQGDTSVTQTVSFTNS